MSWLQFIASLAGSLAWPATVVVAFFLLKNNLSVLFPFVERLKYRGFEVEFRKVVQELTAQSRGVVSAPAEDEERAPLLNRLYELAEVSPRSAILESWLQVETAAIEALQNAVPPPKGKLVGMAPLRLGENLNRREIINGQQLEVFHRLRELRNKAVHVGDAVFKADEVAEYVALATSLATQIRRGSYG